MKRYLAVGIFVLAVALIVSVPVFANGNNSGDIQNQGCPPGFDHVHEVHEDGGHNHDGDSAGHHHVGNDKDQNGDTLICVKHVGKGDKNHVHADNNYRRGQQPE